MRVLPSIALAACTGEGVLEDAAVVDAFGAEDAAADAGSVFDPAVADFVRVTLRSGDVHEGELIHRYDRRIWWQPEDDETWAIFDARRFDVYPEDRSLTFVRASEIADVERAPAGERYRDFLRQRHITLDRPPLDGEAFVITGHASYHLEENGYGDFAWDFVRTSSGGQRFADLGTENDDYFIWDDPVVLPTSGVVVEIEESAPDHAPGSYPLGAVNNLVGVHVGGHYSVYLLHLREGSVPDAISIGAPLSEGAPVGRAGNSGVSLEPHLHVTLLFYDVTQPVPRSFSVPVEFRDVVVRTGTSSVRLAFADPAAGQHLSE